MKKPLSCANTVCNDIAYARTSMIIRHSRQVTTGFIKEKINMFFSRNNTFPINMYYSVGRINFYTLLTDHFTIHLYASCRNELFRNTP